MTDSSDQGRTQGGLPHGAVSDGYVGGLGEYALQYAGRGWPVFPLRPGGKTPLVKGGFNRATTDLATISAWWGRWPDANIGIATGQDTDSNGQAASPVTVLDVDGPEGLAELQGLISTHGPLTRTLAARTGTGAHLYYAGNGVRSSARGKLHVRGTGGYVVAPPSLHPSGRRYEWINPGEVGTVPLQDWLKGWMQDVKRTRETATTGTTLPAPPSYLAGWRADPLASRALAALKEAETTGSPEDLERIQSALAVIPAVDREIWRDVGMILKGLKLVGSGGSNLGYELWDQWSQTCPEKYHPAVLDYQWNSFKEDYPGGLTIASLIKIARRFGWRDPAVSGNPVVITEKARTVYPAVNDWPDGFRAHSLGKDVAGNKIVQMRPQPTAANVQHAIRKMGFACGHDLFKNKKRISGPGVENYEGPLTDEVVLAAVNLIYNAYRFDAGKNETRRAIEQECVDHCYDPVLDYFDGLTWDRVPRLTDWLVTYLGAEPTAFNRAIGAKVLIAAVRRQYEPGTKFDQLLVLEGPEGTNKSTVLRKLAVRDEWFKDKDVLHVNNREQQETMQGVLILEVSELKGIRRAEVSAIKQFLSRQEDTARPAYGHYELEMRRRAIPIGTTNESVYLIADENRRIWPVVTGMIDVEAFTRDRDQIWAEAATRERTGESVMLEPGLWWQAREEQISRREEDPWHDTVAQYLTGKNDTSITEILTLCLHKLISDINRADQMRVQSILARLKYIRYRIGTENRPWRYKSPNG